MSSSLIVLARATMDLIDRSAAAPRAPASPVASGTTSPEMFAAIRAGTAARETEPRSAGLAAAVQRRIGELPAPGSAAHALDASIAAELRPADADDRAGRLAKAVARQVVARCGQEAAAPAIEYALSGGIRRLPRSIDERRVRVIPAAPRR